MLLVQLNEEDVIEINFKIKELNWGFLKYSNLIEHFNIIRGPNKILNLYFINTKLFKGIILF